jgi:uncharacterized protein
MFGAAFILGLAGSLHCAGMCGPIVLLASARAGSVGGRVAYHGGRITTYAVIGAVFGAIGRTFALAGFQRGVSIAAGLILVGGALAGARIWSSGAASAYFQSLRAPFAALLGRRSVGAMFGLGLLNGLLPCGLVYAAATAAAVSADVMRAVIYMVVFGAGTLPLLLAAASAGGRLPFAVLARVRSFLPVVTICVGVLLVLRGLSLGIPYVSPVMAAGHAACH